MKVPSTVSELKELIFTMSHRERVCFPASAQLRKAFNLVDTIEIYTTTLFESKYCDKNVNIKATTVDGKMVSIDNGICKVSSDRPLLNKSKYLRLMRDDYFQEIFNILDKGEIIDERGMITIAGNGTPVIR